MNSTRSKYNKWKGKRKALDLLDKNYTKGRYFSKGEVTIKNADLSCIPEYIKYLDDTKSLMMHNNFIRKIPEWIKELKELKILCLSNNNLYDIPEEISELKDLEMLLLGGNNIHSLPVDVLKKCSSLNAIWINENPIFYEEVKKLRNNLPEVRIHYDSTNNERYFMT